MDPNEITTAMNYRMSQEAREMLTTASTKQRVADGEIVAAESGETDSSEDAGDDQKEEVGEIVEKLKKALKDKENGRG